MSTFFETEPQPTASVILHTTGGEIAVELFAKQTPLTCRNFLQHCLDGYYDNTVFHRLVPGFILQGGDPTGTGNGGESIYDSGALSGDLDPWPMDQRKGHNAGPHGINFKDEFHTRLKFNRRGLLGMANEGAPNTNSSQFFFTLDRADELNGKNTVFGRVAGPTIYNLNKMAESELLPNSERPMYPAQVTRVEILTNPFADMRKTERRTTAALQPPASSSAADADKKAKAKRKKGVNKNLLSFGDDIDLDQEAEQMRKKPKKATAAGRGEAEKRDKRPERNNGRMEESTTNQRSQSMDKTQLQASATSRSRSRSPAPKPPRTKQQADTAFSDEDSEPEPAEARRQTALERTNAEIAALKASMRRPAYVAPVEKQEKKSALEMLIPANTTKGKKLGKSAAAGTSQDPKTLQFLSAFQSKLAKESAEYRAKKKPVPTPPQPGSANGDAATADATADAAADAAADATAEEGNGEVCDLHFIANCQSCRPWDKAAEAHQDNSDSDDWMAHTLNCTADKLGKDLSYRKKAEEELIMIDPREKARAIKEELQAERRTNGRGNDRARDRARHGQMSRAAALSGRAAR